MLQTVAIGFLIQYYEGRTSRGRTASTLILICLVTEEFWHQNLFRELYFVKMKSETIHETLLNPFVKV